VTADDARLRTNLLECLRLQAAACAALGSPFYAALLPRVQDDVVAGGPLWSVLHPYAGLPFEAAVALRLLGAVHRLVLAGRAPALARHYPSTGGDGDADGAWPAFRALVGSHAAALAPVLEHPPQTNEVGRAAALVGGFLRVAAEGGLPLRLLELGASAGLHLRFDGYRYEAGAQAFGDPGSPVRFVDWWDGVPPLDARCTVAARAGCDARPVDASSAGGRLALEAYVWPDQRERLALLRGALAVAARVPAPIERAGAAGWLASQLARPAAGVTTVVFHAIVWQYLADAERASVRGTLAAAAARATPDAPLAWLRFEPSADKRHGEVRLVRWPGGEEVLLATAGYHGRPVRWLAP
jgi:hypothetical protein